MAWLEDAEGKGVMQKLPGTDRLEASLQALSLIHILLNIIFLLLLGSLRNLNLQDTITDLSRNLLLISILWKSVALRVAAVRELTT